MCETLGIFGLLSINCLYQLFPIINCWHSRWKPVSLVLLCTYIHFHVMIYYVYKCSISACFFKETWAYTGSTAYMQCIYVQLNSFALSKWRKNYIVRCNITNITGICLVGTRERECLLLPDCYTFKSFVCQSTAMYSEFTYTIHAFVYIVI